MKQEKLNELPRDSHHFADLEVRILPRREAGYPVEITFSGELEFPAGELDAAVLPWVPGVSAREDGERLFGLLFGDPRLQAAWNEARGHSPARRIRLRVDAEAPELHTVPWELLAEHRPGEPAQQLAATAGTPFSRYLAGAWRHGRAVIERPLRLLVAIAAPENLEESQLDPLDLELERRALEAALAEVEPGQLEVTFLPPPVTLAALEEALGGVHALHLVAHGRFAASSGRAALYLADADNRVAFTRDEDFIAMLQRRGEALRLVFLATCQSASRSPADAFRGLAPGLLAAGVPAVVAMQDRVEVAAARTFAGTFYRRLLRHGQVDLAANQARSALLTTEAEAASELPACAVPVLFQRLRDSRLFGCRGQVLGPREAGFWTMLLENIADGECTPLIGPGALAGLLPSPGELAVSLARKYGYPFPDAESLPRVAQYVGTLDQTSLRRDLRRLCAAGFRAWHGLAPEPEDRRRSLEETLRAAGWAELVAAQREGEIHHQLADLGLPLYLTTNLDSFMTLALEAQGRAPRREVLAWRGDAGRSGDPLFDLEPPATAEEPVVLHLFGHDDDPRSLVLTEDDHLDFLSRISRDHEYLLPAGVSAALARTTLLFLGYDLRDLDLKIILRGLLSHLDAAGWDRLHVAVQIDHHDAADATTEEIKRFLERYFGKAEVNVYWGSTQQFVNELHQRWCEHMHHRC